MTVYDSERTLPQLHRQCRRQENFPIWPNGSNCPGSYIFPSFAEIYIACGPFFGYASKVRGLCRLGDANRWTPAFTPTCCA
jgi:hypothetical protein